MEITGRITADAKNSKLADGREVTNFTLVINDQFKTKNGDRKEVSTFFKCAYWVSPKAANYLKKGIIISAKPVEAPIPSIIKRGFDDCIQLLCNKYLFL